MYNNEKAIAIAAQFCAAKYGVDAHGLMRQASTHTQDEWDFSFKIPSGELVIVRAEGPYDDELPEIYTDEELCKLLAKAEPYNRCSSRILSVVASRMVAEDTCFVRHQTTTLARR